MSAYTELYVHCVWATWNRMPLITAKLEPQLHAIIAAKCQEFGCCALATGGMPDHLHVLVRLATTVTIAQLIGALKGKSSYLITREVLPGLFFRWQGGYGAFTVSTRSLAQVQRYIDNQKHHHSEGSLIAELEQSFSPHQPGA